MRTLNISISEFDYNKLGLTNNNLSFSELKEIINKKNEKANLEKSVAFAEKYKLSTLSMDEITSEVKTLRKDAKNRD